MQKNDIIKTAQLFVENSSDNYINRQIAISNQVVGMKIFEAPIFAFGSANDEYFTLMKKPSIIGEHFLLPTEWLPSAKTVISFFLPFSEQVRKGNKNNKSWPSPEWLHARIEGQAFLNNLSLHLKEALCSAGFKTIVPILEGKFYAVTTPIHPGLSFTSNWSERHVAYICGLGTFSLSKGLITSKGMAGRFGSLITELSLAPSTKNYQSIDEYCSMCGKCAKNCPVNAISLENGKDHFICSAFLNKTEEKFNPRYGCGKCQVNVPCETRIPKGKRK